MNPIRISLWTYQPPVEKYFHQITQTSSSYHERRKQLEPPLDSSPLTILDLMTRNRLKVVGLVARSARNQVRHRVLVAQEISMAGREEENCEQLESKSRSLGLFVAH